MISYISDHLQAFGHFSYHKYVTKISSKKSIVAMEIDSTTCEQGLKGRVCDWAKALFGKTRTNMVNVVERIMKLARDDPRRVIHSFKVALALTFVSLIYYIRPLYDGFGVAGIWAVLTVVVIFEFTVGKINMCLG